MEKFFLDNYLRATNEILMESEKCTNQFENVCISILSDFFNEWKEGKEELSSLLNIQKRAIIGYEKEVAFFKDKIKLFLKMRGQTLSYCPDHYLDIEDGIYNECFGLAGISEWFTDKYSESSSAKIIGDRIYFLEKGKMILKPQRIEKDRREQLIRAFLLLTPTERLDKNFHEIYMLDGTRVTIFGGEMTKNDQDVIIFRRYIIPMYTFEEQASRGTIPIEAKDLFVNMVDIGYNVAFLGAVRSAKTSFLATWQSYEDANLEGVMVETDPEIPIHNIMKNAPIIHTIVYNYSLILLLKFEHLLPHE